MAGGWNKYEGRVGMKLQILVDAFEKDRPEFHSEIIGNCEAEIKGLNLCNRASNCESIISYAVSGKYVEMVEKAVHIKALVIKKEDADLYGNVMNKKNGVLVCVEEPEIYFYHLHEFLYAKTNFYKKYDFESEVGKDCKIDESVVIERGVRIGSNVTIGANTVVKHGTVIKDNVTIGCNSTIGSEGFQLITNGKQAPLHITHVGGCLISENVYIGDNSCICNSLFEGDTFIGENVKIDNLVHIAHNLHIEKNAVITAHVIICGSVVIEEGAWIAPNASIINRVTIGKYSKVGMGSVVTKDVVPYSVVYGSPAKDHSKN